MKSLLKKNNDQRIIFHNKEKKRLALHSILNNFNLSFHLRWKTQQFYTEFNAQSSKTQIKNRCVITGRTRGIYRFVKLSRLQFRALASKGVLPGISKISW